jgi:hypothetical protein
MFTKEQAAQLVSTGWILAKDCGHRNHPGYVRDSAYGGFYSMKAGTAKVPGRLQLDVFHKGQNVPALTLWKTLEEVLAYVANS